MSSNTLLSTRTMLTLPSREGKVSSVLSRPLPATQMRHQRPLTALAARFLEPDGVALHHELDLAVRQKSGRSRIWTGIVTAPFVT
jgi:hypothetical protein